MTVVSEPRVGTIYWTAFTDLEGDSEPVDPLRFDMFVQRIGNVLLPGITNRVQRLRYFGMVCAGLLHTRDAGATVRERRHSFLPFERAWALAVTADARGNLKAVGPGQRRPALRREYRGLRGANHVLSYYRREAPKAAIHPTNYRLLVAQESQGGLGSYLVVLRQYGFVQPDSVELTAVGHDLAEAFVAGAQPALVRELLEDRSVRRARLERVGEALTLARPSRAEADIVRRALFDGHSRTADVIHRIRRVIRRPNDPRGAFEVLAERDRDPLAIAARYALDFDPLRVSLLTLFAELGRRLAGRAGAVPVHELATDALEVACANAREAASTLAADDSIPGLEEVSRLARRLAETRSTAELVHETVLFHRNQGRSWIIDHGRSQYELGRAGTFEDPPSTFNGYTLPSALSVLRDVEEAT